MGFVHGPDIDYTEEINPDAFALESEVLTNKIKI